MPANSSPDRYFSPDHPALDGLLNQVRETARRKHLSIHTEDAYAHTIRRFLDFHAPRDPRQMGAPEVRAYLTHLAVERTVAASTQNVARTACWRGVRRGSAVFLRVISGRRRGAGMVRVFGRT